MSHTWTFTIDELTIGEVYRYTTYVSENPKENPTELRLLIHYNKLYQLAHQKRNMVSDGTQSTILEFLSIIDKLVNNWNKRAECGAVFITDNHITKTLQGTTPKIITLQKIDTHG